MVSLLLVCLAAPACKGRGPRSPEQLREEYAEALRNDDPTRAYALLAPQAQARISPEEFAARWKSGKKERKLALERLDALDDDRRAAVHAGTTVHDGGRTLRWVRAGDRYLIVDGLPGLPDTTTPAQTIRAFISAVRRADLAGIDALLSKQLSESMREDWTARVEAIERALERPGAVELSPDLRRAELRYDGHRAVALEQTARGWRITALE